MAEHAKSITGKVASKAGKSRQALRKIATFARGAYLQSQLRRLLPRSACRRNRLFKTLVAQRDRRGICMAIIPANTELDVKALAAVSGNRKIDLVPVKELQKLAGYIRGGVTALAASISGSRR